MNDCFKYFTTYNLYATIVVVLFGKRLLNDRVIDIVRGTAFLVAACVGYMYLVFGAGAVLSMYRRINPSWSDCSNLLYDWAVHFAPLLILGLPSASSLMIAFAVLLVWYMFVIRDEVSRLYIQSIPGSGYDKMMVVVFMVVLVYILVRVLLFKSKARPL